MISSNDELQNLRVSRRPVWLALALVAIAILVSAIAYRSLPATVPIHWDMRGHVNGYGSRLVATSLTPLIMILLTAMMVIVPATWPRALIRYDRDDTPRIAMRNAVSMIGVLVLALLVVIHALALSVASGVLSTAAMPRAVLVVVSLLLIAIGNYLPRVTHRNAFIGLRFPWTFASDEVWRRSQRIGGYSMVAAGIAGVLAVMLVPNEAATVVIVAVVASTIWSAVYSYAIAHRASADV